MVVEIESGFLNRIVLNTKQATAEKDVPKTRYQLINFNKRVVLEVDVKCIKAEYLSELMAKTQMNES
jgi:hypothetical protein